MAFLAQLHEELAACQAANDIPLRWEFDPQFADFILHLAGMESYERITVCGLPVFVNEHSDVSFGLLTVGQCWDDPEATEVSGQNPTS